MTRSWVCPGAGFALLGRPTVALLAYLSALALLPAVTWVAWQPDALAAWLLVGVFAVAVVLSLAEQWACLAAAPQPVGPKFLVERFPVASIIFWTAVASILVVVFSGFRSLQMAGSGMSPSLETGERFLYSRRVEPSRHQRGAVIVFRLSEQSAWGRPGWLTVSRILAVPGDRLMIREGQYVVNGGAGQAVSGTQPYTPVVNVPTEPRVMIVPDGHYFVVQDNPTGSYDSQVLSWVAEGNIVADRLFALSGRGYLTCVK